MIQRAAKKRYKDGKSAFFSILAMHMSEDTLEARLDIAFEDKNVSFGSILYNALDRDGEFDELEERQEKEWKKAQMAECWASGVTMDGKNFYYQGQLVNIFLDIRLNNSFYTLDMNPSGIVNIKIIRNTENEITGVAYMAETEVDELFADEDDPDNKFNR